MLPGFYSESLQIMWREGIADILNADIRSD